MDKDEHGNYSANMNARFKDLHPKDRRIPKSLPGSARGTPKMAPAGFSYENMGFSLPYNHLAPGREMLNFVKMDSFNLKDDEVDHSHMPQGSFVQRDGIGSSSHSSIGHSTHQESNLSVPLVGPEENEASHASYLQSSIWGSELETLEEGENQEEEGDFEDVEKGVEIQMPVEGISDTAINSEENLEEKIEKTGEGEIMKVVQKDQHRQNKKLTEGDSIFEKIHALESEILEKTSNELSVDSVNQNRIN